MSNGTVPPFVNLQNGFYNAISQALGFAPGSPFQLLQPTTTIPNATPTPNQTLWNYLNMIPPASLTSFVASGGNQFFNDYSAVISALIPATTVNVKADIGDDCWNDWLAYVKGMSPIPTAAQLSTLFLNWASVYYPNVANIGSSDYATIALDPISAAQQMLLLAYGQTPPPPKQPDWSLGYDYMVQQLATGQNLVLPNFSSATMNSSTSSTWAEQSTEGLFGLWGSSSSSSSTSSAFAAGTVTMNVTIEHVTTFSPSPGAWYSSAALGLAYSAGQGNRPWNPNSAITWQKTFGADSAPGKGDGGNMQRFAASLVIASGMTINVTSTAVMTADQVSQTNYNSGAGLWPFYTTGGSGGSSSSATQNADGTMTLTIATPKDVPTVIGANVLPASQFLGHQAQALAQLERYEVSDRAVGGLANGNRRAPFAPRGKREPAHA